MEGHAYDKGHKSAIPFLQDTKTRKEGHFEVHQNGSLAPRASQPRAKRCTKRETLDEHAVRLSTSVRYVPAQGVSVGIICGCDLDFFIWHKALQATELMF